MIDRTPSFTARHAVPIDACLPRRFAVALAGGLLIAALSWARPAGADTLAQDKVAADLKGVIAARTTPVVSWAKDVAGVRLVKVLVISNSPDPDLTDLRARIIDAGGSVYMRYVSVRALSVLMPARRVASRGGAACHQPC